MAATYDEKVIQRFADGLYRRAARVVIIYAIIGFGIGFLLMTIADHGGAGMLRVIIGGLAALVGVILSRDKAEALRLQAQTALCQAQIERNTRPATSSAASEPSSSAA